MKEKMFEVAKKVRDVRPLVHCMTNHVTVNDCANIVLAAGASPTMAHHREEVEEVTQGCNSLVCNLGATDDYEAMLLAAQAATIVRHPIIIDPVGVGGSSFRRKQFVKLLEVAKPTCIRGNFSEIQALFWEQATVTGVDAGVDTLSMEEKDCLVRDFSSKIGCMVIASGATDMISDGNRCIHVSNGTPQMARITGSGCMSSALLGAYLAVENSLEAAAAACFAMGYCGELAEARTREQQGGTMTFRMLLTDEVSRLAEEH